jgi:hypothetical protein
VRESVHPHSDYYESGPGTGVSGGWGVRGRLQDRVVGDQNRYATQLVGGVAMAAN